MQEINKIAVYSGFTKKAGELRKKLVAKFKKAGFTVGEEGPDLIVTIGGDGTLLNYVRVLNYPSVPFIGINAGTVGFMQELETKDIDPFIKELKRGDYKIIEIPLLHGEVRGDKNAGTHGFNEIVIERDSSRAAHLHIHINGKRFERFVGDGLIFTTPQGSTAYGAAAGGAIFPFSVKAYQFVPSNPHDSVANRTIKSPMLMPESAVVDIHVDDPAHRPVQVIADGEKVEAGVIKKVEIKISSHKFHMLRTHRFNFYERMSRKLIGS